MNPGRKRRLLTRLNKTGRFALLTLFFLGVAAPIYWFFITSLKDQKDIISLNIQYWPQNITAENYINLFEHSNFPVFLKNSILVSLVTAFLVLVISVLGGYGLARYRFKMKNAVYFGFLISQMIPMTLILIPLYTLFSKLSLTDTLTGLVFFYSIINTPFCVITMQGFFANIPSVIEEAAAMDGCTKRQILTRIVLPLMLPGIIAVFIFAFIGAWNELLGGTLFIYSELKKTVPVGLNGYVGQFSINWGEMTAGGMMALLPSVVLFSIAQKYIVQGLTSGAVKG